MSDVNPYASGPPKNDLDIPLAGGDFPLASLWQRFAGCFVDIALLIIVMIGVYSGVAMTWVSFLEPEFAFGDSTEMSPFSEFAIRNVLPLVSTMIAFVLLNGYLIAKRGQTIGKFLLGTQMVGDDDQRVSFARIFLNRYCLFWVLSVIPMLQLISIVDPFPVFGQSRKCLHDRVARTKVISLR